MIIKLPITFIPFAGQKESKAVKTLSYTDKIKADRLVMAILLMLTIVGAIIVS